MKILIIIAVVVILALIIGSQAIYTIDMTEQAVLLQFGEYVRTVREPGLHFKTPFIQSVNRMEKRVLLTDAPAERYITSEKKYLDVDHITRWRIADPFKFYKTVANEAGARARLHPIIAAELKAEVATHTFADIVSAQREAIMETVAERARPKAEEYGIEIVDVRIKRTDLPGEVQASVYDRMRAERERIAKRYRAEGEEEAFKLRADADKEKTIIAAEAYEKSQKLMGEGDAEATAIYAAAFGRDPEFYSFLRTMQAYEAFLVGETTLVLSSDSELFSYLGSPNTKASQLSAVVE